MSIGIDASARCPHGNDFKWECPHCYRELTGRIATLERDNGALVKEIEEERQRVEFLRTQVTDMNAACDALAAKNKRLVNVLRTAGDDIHSEYCGGMHSIKCARVTDALAANDRAEQGKGQSE